MKNLKLRFRILLAALAGLAAFGLVHAATSIYESPGTRYVAHWTWNDAAAGTSSVEVLLKAAPPRRPPERLAPPPVPCVLNVKVLVLARAADGSTLQNYALVQLKAAQPKKVELEFEQPLTSLEFIRILTLSSNGACGLGL